MLDALCLSGLPTDRFCYEGFLPRKHSERVQYLRTLRSERRTIVFYETLHRIDDSMADLLDVFGPNRKMALCRELTKDFEQIRRGTIAQIRQSVIDEPPRGEMVLVVAGASEEEADAAAPASLSVEDLAVLSTVRRKTICASKTRFRRSLPSIPLRTARLPIASRSTMRFLR